MAKTYEEKHALGSFYTPPDIVQKLIGPLFLDEYKAKVKQMVFDGDDDGLIALAQELTRLRFYDPTCGDGAILWETYMSLLSLESEIHRAIGWDAECHDVSAGQFYGTDIDQEAVLALRDRMPGVNAWVGNSAKWDHCACWGHNLPQHTYFDYIIGNPPFIGYSLLDEQQKKDRAKVFEGNKGGGTLDYVCCWFELATRYMEKSGGKTRAAFVSTNSICQGQQVEPLWRPILEERGYHIDFAWQSFPWESDPEHKAAVTVIIVSWSKVDGIQPVLFKKDGERVECEHINGYLKAAGDVFIGSRNTALSPDAPKMKNGLAPTDHGWLLLSWEEYILLCGGTPEGLDKYRRVMGAKCTIELINGWLNPEVFAWMYLRAMEDGDEDFRKAAIKFKPAASDEEARATLEQRYREYCPDGPKHR